jgi:hypothetical protein
MALGPTQPLTEMSTRNISWGQRRPVRKADNLTTFMGHLSKYLGALTSWNPRGLSRPVMGLLYLYEGLLACSLVRVLSQTNTVHLFKSFFNILFNIFLCLRLYLPFHPICSRLLLYQLRSLKPINKAAGH